MRNRAAAGAEAETRSWSGILGSVAAWSGQVGAPAPREIEVLGIDPAVDLAHRGKKWGFQFETDTLTELVRFAAGLAQAESEAWDDDDAVLATKAFEDRRFLLADRIAAWAIPWADVAGRCHPAVREGCHQVRDALIGAAEAMRIAPLITGDEGIFPPGEDSYGPQPPGMPDALCLLTSGTVIFEATVVSLGASGRSGAEIVASVHHHDLEAFYANAAARWAGMATANPGSARLWRDLSRRAASTGAWLSQTG